MYHKYHKVSQRLGGGLVEEEEKRERESASECARAREERTRGVSLLASCDMFFVKHITACQERERARGGARACACVRVRSEDIKG